jgi:integrase
MASIEKRPNGRWRARYKDDAGKEHTRAFVRKIDAQRWIDETTAAIVTGQYVDPRAGRVTFRDYAEQWRAMQTHKPTTRDHHETMLRRHVYPTLGDRPIASILPSEIQAWVARLSAGDPNTKRKPLAASTIETLHSVVSAVMKDAVRDRRIVSNPCMGTKLPKKMKSKVVPPTTEQVMAMVDAMPPNLQAAITLAAGSGLRQGELFGLTADRVNMLRREITIDRQLASRANHKPYLATPKTAASARTIPIPPTVVAALAAHMAAFPPNDEGFIFTIDGNPISRQAFGHIFRPVARGLGLPAGTGLHALRHYYASLLIRFG